MKKHMLWFIIGMGLLLMFAVFSKSVKQGFLKTRDFAVTVKVQERIDGSSRLRLASLVGDVMEGSTFFASPVFSSVVVMALTGFAFFKTKTWRKKFAVIAIPVCFALIVAGEVYGKSVVHHPAAPFFMIKNPTTIFPKYYINEQFSYPSGHAARAVFIGIVVFATVQHLHKKITKKHLIIGLFLGAYVMLVSVSRIYLGHHWLSDIVGGILLGGGFGSLAILSFGERK